MHHANDNDNALQLPLRFLSVCSGIEAASTAWHPLGWRAVAFSEIEKFPSAVLAHHYPDVPNLGDFTKIDTTKLGQVDILAGGTPCQAFSVAGLRHGLDDARGNLTLKFVELAHELADGNGLRNVVWENVVGVLSDKGNAFGCFLAGLVGADAPIVPPGRWTNAGMVSGPRGRAAWRVLDAQYFGVAQRRRRVIVVADFGNGADPAAVLLIEQGLPRHPPARGEAGKDVAPTISARTKGGGGLGTDFDLDGGLRVQTFDRQSNCEYGEAGIASTDSARDYKSPTDLVAIGVTGTTSHALTAEGVDASEDGSGHWTPVVVAFNAEAQADQSPGVGRDTDVNDGLTVSQRAAVAITGSVAFVQNSRDEVRLMGGDGSIVGALAAESGAKQQCYLAQTVAIRGRDGGATAELGGDVATALRASQGGGDKPHVLAEVRPINTQVGLRHQALGERTGLGIGGDGDPSFTLSKSHSHAVQVSSAVRRLTPMECERLQGFPDGYTAIPWRGKPADRCPDGPRYKALGNSWAVPKFTWLGRRIAQFMPAATANTMQEAA